MDTSLLFHVALLLKKTLTYSFFRVICKETIEERIEQLQQKKLALAENVLTGQLRKEISKLSLQDLKSLFDLNPPPRP